MGPVRLCLRPRLEFLASVPSQHNQRRDTLARRTRTHKVPTACIASSHVAACWAGLVSLRWLHAGLGWAGLRAGFSGADLSNLVNEAAIVAAKQGGDHITHSMFDYAFDKILMGVERKSVRRTLEART